MSRIKIYTCFSCILQLIFHYFRETNAISHIYRLHYKPEVSGNDMSIYYIHICIVCAFRQNIGVCFKRNHYIIMNFSNKQQQAYIASNQRRKTRGAEKQNKKRRRKKRNLVRTIKTLKVRNLSTIQIAAVVVTVGCFVRCSLFDNFRSDFVESYFRAVASVET